MKSGSVGFPDHFFRDFYDHLNSYNFTVDESSPNYEQVAIDPEMMGRIFENMLASQLDEAGQSARKSQGGVLYSS